MNLWQRASGALKDQKAIMTATLSRRRSHRNPDLEAAIIKATNHNEAYVDYRNAQRVFAWIRTSPVSLKPLIWALTSRLEKSQSWVVALKALMLIHGVFCLKTPAVFRIGKLPFDLSNFSDGHSKKNYDTMRGFNAFIRSYYTYLDRRSLFLYGQQFLQTEQRLVSDVTYLENLQSLLDILLQIKPDGNQMKVKLIFEAMDCVLIEIFDLHNRISNLIANVLMDIYSAGKGEAAMALKVLQKTKIQGDDLVGYFEFCREFGILNAMEVPKFVQVSDENIKHLKGLINGVSERKNNVKIVVKPQPKNEKKINIDVVEENKGAVISRLKTVITDKWEVFEEDNYINNHVQINSYNPFDLPSSGLSLIPVYKLDQIPDFISF